MRPYIITMLFLLPSLMLQAAVTVINQSPDEILLEFTLPDYELDHQLINGNTWHRIVSDEGMVHAEEGFPEVRMFSEAVAIPIDGSATAQIVDVSNTVLKNINLKPVYKMVVDKE
ncbi:MAG TPA: hypothetical protein PKH19_04465, partial [Candidatus Syntrophosphaera sp.]|nr:hypothetical protein [Candidatus Syntrophosphaera sp.]